MRKLSRNWGAERVLVKKYCKFSIQKCTRFCRNV